MRRATVVFLCSFLILILAAVGSSARKTTTDSQIRFTQSPAPADLPPELQALVQKPQLSSAAADTFHLAWFSFGSGSPDAQGWTTVDLTAQLGDFFHVADASELDGGTFGNLLPLEGSQSMWCGAPPSAAIPFCGYATLPGYGNAWSQEMTSKVFAGCDSINLYYKIAWDSEQGYDFTFVEWRNASSSTWTAFSAVDGASGNYDGTGQLTECLGASSDGSGVQLRFRFVSDGAWSDQDGLWPTDGAVRIDSITVVWYNEVPPASGNWVVSASNFEDFEGETPGDNATTDACWVGAGTPGFGDFAALYPGVNLTQEDPCFQNFGLLWGFFDDPAITAYLCHSPNPLPAQGAMRFGPDAAGLYLQSAIESPLIPNAGAGDEYWLSFLTYRDLPLDNLQFYAWSITGVVGGCPDNWGDNNFVFYGGQKDWLRTNFSVGTHINLAASHILIQIRAMDGCAFWCGIFGNGACHSHAPLIDEVHLKRVNVVGPQFSVRHIDLFQDTFAEDGTLTGHARADCANDIAPSASATILPGDSLTITASGVGTDPNTGIGPAAYIYVALLPRNQPGKTPADMEAPETRAGVGKRWPLVDTFVHKGLTWACFRMDSAITTAGFPVADRYCVDLNDVVFTPCDTIAYIIAADDGAGNARYFTRFVHPWGSNNIGGTFGGPDLVTASLNQALSSPMEFQVLPGAGWKRGGDILYVDDADDRGGPPQLFMDWTLLNLGIHYYVDRYDVLGPSSNVGNGLASRVKNISTQIVGCYRKIIWNSGDLSSGLIGDGTGNPEKSDDYSLLYTFLDTSPNLPGLYLSGDDLAEEWVALGGAGAINLRSIYMNFNLVSGDHVGAGEAVSPILTATGPCFIELGIPNKLIAYGGCPLINDFDVLQTAGLSTTEFPYPNGSGDAVISQATPNSAASTARIILSGFSFHYIRNITPGYPLERDRHLRNILIWLQNIIAPAIGVPDLAGRDYLSNAAPNPFNPETTIRYGVRERGHVALKVYNVAGQLVRTLVNEVKTPNEAGFEVAWDGRDDRGVQVSTGVYFYKLSTAGFTLTKKMVLLK